MAEIVTPNEIAKRLAVTGLAFRNWLREQKATGHPLLGSHEYRTRYQFTRAEADQLAAEFAEQVLGTSATRVNATTPSTRTDNSGRARVGPARAQTEGSTSAGSRVEHPRSDDPGHRVTVEWMGEEVETLADLLRPGLRAVAIGINPAPRSVATGHYYQGNYGQTFFRRLRRAGLLPDGDGFEDDRSFAAGTGFTDVVKRPTPGKQGLRSGELEHGRTILEAKLTTPDVPLVIFVSRAPPRRCWALCPRTPTVSCHVAGSAKRASSSCPVPRPRARSSPTRSRSSSGLCAPGPEDARAR